MKQQQQNVTANPAGSPKVKLEQRDYTRSQFIRDLTKVSRKSPSKS